jgi:hypothetical protein
MKNICPWAKKLSYLFKNNFFEKNNVPHEPGSQGSKGHKLPWGIRR